MLPTHAISISQQTHFSGWDEMPCSKLGLLANKVKQKRIAACLLHTGMHVPGRSIRSTLVKLNLTFSNGRHTDLELAHWSRPALY